MKREYTQPTAEKIEFDYTTVTAVASTCSTNTGKVTCENWGLAEYANK